MQCLSSDVGYMFILLYTSSVRLHHCLILRNQDRLLRSIDPLPYSLMLNPSVLPSFSFNRRARFLNVNKISCVRDFSSIFSMAMNILYHKYEISVTALFGIFYL